MNPTNPINPMSPMSPSRSYKYKLISFSLLASAAISSVSPPAFAQSSGRRAPIESPSIVAARATFEQGVHLLQDSQFAQAAAAFERSYQDNPVPVVLFNLAFAYRGQGRTIEALRTLERFLQNPGNTPADRITSARDELTQLTAMVAHVNIVRAPASTQVAIDGHPAEGNLAEILLNPGAHVIEGRSEGYRPFRQEITLAPGAHESITVRLAEIDDAGRLRVEPSVTNARISLDGALIGVGSVEVGAHAGMHRLDIIAEGYLPLHREVRVPGVGLIRVDAQLQRPRANPWPWLGPVIAVGAATAIGLSIWGIAEATRGEVGPSVPNCWNCVLGR